MASTSGTTDQTKSTHLTKNPEKPVKRRETVLGSIRLIYNGYRYSLWDLFPDGTTYWCCWGIRCKKSVHMTPQGLIYSKNETQEHQHPPQVTKVDQITHEDGQKEWYAIFKDLLHNTILVYRNTLWDLVLGEQCYIATCQRCETVLKITENFTRFSQSNECSKHDDSLILIRVTAKPAEGDPIIWEMFKRKFPLQLTDGTIFNKGRHSQMFVGEFRYTLVGFTWSGGEMWRCAIQRCPARCKIAELRGDFNTPVHNHDKQILLQGQIWSEARQRQESYFVVITLKKTIATLYYNTYCYALKDKQQNIWSCFPGPCHALLRIEGDFERVVEEMDHSHDGTLTFIRSDETYASQKCYGPAIGTAKKRPREESESSAVEVDPLSLLNVSIDAPATEQSNYLKEEPSDSLMDVDSLSQSNATEESSSSVNVSPKLQEIINALVQPVPKNDPSVLIEPLLQYYGGHTYCRTTVQKDGGIRMECNKPRCPGRIVIGPDQVPRVKDPHTHPKTYESIGSICDFNNQYYQYILVNGSHRRMPTYFVCDGFRYNMQAKALNEDTEIVWQCNNCTAKATVTASYSHIQFSGSHTHDPHDIILPGDENSDSIAEDSQDGEGPSNSFHLDEVIWDQHRYNKPIFIRRLNTSKWRCYRTRECKAHINQNAEGVFKEIEPHDHEGPIECCGEARFDPTMKLKDRFAIMKNYGKSKLRHLVFQNQIYIERNDCIWECASKSCNAQLNVYDNFDFIQAVGVHTHQPVVTQILFPNEVQRHITSADML
ncbi:AAEL000396-PA [Aedes aegypti]|nr:AAEL000396-PA [Aedes aegypti]